MWFRRQQMRLESLARTQSDEAELVGHSSEVAVEPSNPQFVRGPLRRSNGKPHAAKIAEVMQAIFVRPRESARVDTEWTEVAGEEEWGVAGVFAEFKSAKGFTDPQILPVARSQYGILDHIVDGPLGMSDQTFLGIGKAAADGTPATLPLASLYSEGGVAGRWLESDHRFTKDELDISNSVARVHDIYLQQSGGEWFEVWNPEVTKAHNYAADHFQAPLLRATFGVLGGAGSAFAAVKKVYNESVERADRNRAARVEVEKAVESWYPPRYPRSMLPPMTSQFVDQIKMAEEQKSLNALQDAYDNR